MKQADGPTGFIHVERPIGLRGANGDQIAMDGHRRAEKVCAQRGCFSQGAVVSQIVGAHGPVGVA